MFQNFRYFDQFVVQLQDDSAALFLYKEFGCANYLCVRGIYWFLRLSFGEFQIHSYDLISFFFLKKF